MFINLEFLYKIRVIKLKRIVIVLDGMADLPNDKLGGKTPLEAANKPNLNEIALKSKLGYMYPVSEEYAPESDTAVVALLGNNPNISSRAQFEALGYGVKLKRGDLVLRANFGTVDTLENRKMLDRRAGRTLTTNEARELAKTLNKDIKLPVKFQFIPTVQHRGLLVFYGGLSDNITNTDTYVHEKGKILVKDCFDWSRSLDEEENTEFSANLVNSFVSQACKILLPHPINKLRIKKGMLPANIILTRDAGVELPVLNKFRGAMAIVNMPLEKGIAKASGMDIFHSEYPEMKGFDVYENLTQGLDEMIKFSIKTLKKEKDNYGFCYIHFKETDVPGHDNKPIEKKTFIEHLDKNFFSFLKEYALKNDVKFLITCDHSTPCKMKTHTSDPVPVLLYDPLQDKSDKLEFGETNCKNGSLGKFYGRQLLKKVGFIS
jgi:2,3-bisphosphoglycerate-independent phosphoglycerate mutase